jgi:hypothetical protein
MCLDEYMVMLIGGYGFQPHTVLAMIQDQVEQALAENEVFFSCCSFLMR